MKVDKGDIHWIIRYVLMRCDANVGKTQKKRLKFISFHLSVSTLFRTFAARLLKHYGKGCLNSTLYLPHKYSILQHFRLLWL